MGHLYLLSDLTLESWGILVSSWLVYVGHLYSLSVSDIGVMGDAEFELTGICGAFAFVVGI